MNCKPPSATAPTSPSSVSPVKLDHLDGVMRLFAQAWWTRDRSRDRVAAMLASSEATTGVVGPDGQLVAFARAISDFEFKALIVDVIVDHPERSSGLGRRVVNELLQHPALAHIDDFELYCEHRLIPYYSKLGFHEPIGTHFMRLPRG